MVIHLLVHAVTRPYIRLFAFGNQDKLFETYGGVNLAKIFPTLAQGIAKSLLWRADLVDGAIVDQDGQSQLALVLGYMSPGTEECVTRPNPDFLGIKEFILCKALPLQTVVTLLLQHILVCVGMLCKLACSEWQCATHFSSWQKRW